MKQAITTKMLPPTVSKPRRIVAEAASGRITLSLCEGYDSDREIHERAARALCERYGWPWDYHPGMLKDGRFVWVSSAGLMDYRELLKEYMWHVGMCEGVYFTPEHTDLAFTSEQVEAMQEINAEVRDEYEERERAARERGD